MRCLACEYSLKGLPTGPCPECGRLFDRNDPESYADGRWPDPAVLRRRARRLELCNLVAAAWLLIVFGLMHVMLLVARISLGRWPGRMGSDDPKQIAGLAPLYALTGLCLLLTPLAPMTNLALIGRVAATQQWRVALRMLLATVVLWLLGIALVRWDPAHVAVWFMD